MLGRLKYVEGQARVAKEPEPFVTTKSVLVVALACAGLSLFGHILHTQHEQREALLLHRRKEVLNQSSLKAEEERRAERLQSQPLTREVYEQCNPALGPAELSGYDPSAVLAGEHCGQADAELIREALRSREFDFQAVEPTPYIFPTYLQRALSTLDNHHLELALQAHGENMTRDHSVLAKFFTWGLPVPAQALRRSLGDAAARALWRCRLVRPCAQHPSVWVGAVQMFPVPYSNVIVATDWPYLKGSAWEDRVAAAEPWILELALSAPPATGMRVLDLSHASGVHGILAARRGAESVTFVSRNPRALRFAQFNAWFNGVGEHMTFKQGRPQLDEMPEGLTPNFDLLLASPSWAPTVSEDGEEALREVLKIGSAFLGKTGSFVLMSELTNPRLLPQHLCEDIGLSGFSGSVVYRNPTVDAIDYAISKEDFAGKDKGAIVGGVLNRLKVLKGLGVEDISDGMIFGWRTPGDSKGCGEWDYVGLQQPWNVQIETPLEQRPCFYNQRKRESCPHIS